ncbi:MAG TPA: PEGA domain-containing protein [Vicinamibacterales bacterium]|nr:PEGA domain-containing protein [Vicinamibacterales bacterium]
MIDLRKTVASLVVFVAALAVAAPVAAQRGRGENRGQSQSGAARSRQAEPRSQPAPARQEAPRERQEAPRQAQGPSRQSQVQPRQQQEPRQQYERPLETQRPSRQTQAQPRQSQESQRPSAQVYRSQPQQAPRSGQIQREGPTVERSRPQGQAVQRQGSQTYNGGYRDSQTSRYQGGASRPGSYQAPRNYSRPQTSYYGGYSRGYIPVRRPVFVQPYYAFRPRLSIGFGISIGYSVGYPFRYYDPYGPYNYGISSLHRYNYGGSGYSSYYSRVGGLSFNIDPYDAEVFIDGQYVGVADDFSPGQMPLTLLAGRHRVDLRADGFMPVSFEITVIAGQVIPYAGTLPY